MKTTIKLIALVVAAATSFNAAADQFNAANGELSNAISDRQMNNNESTNQRVNNAYARTKAAALEGMTVTSAPAANQPTQAELSATFHAIKGERLTADNVQRTAPQVAALNEARNTQQAALRAQFNAIKGEQLTAANVARTQQQLDAKQDALRATFNAIKGEKLTEANINRTTAQISALTNARAEQQAALRATFNAIKGERLTDANIARVQQQVAALTAAQSQPGVISASLVTSSRPAAATDSINVAISSLAAKAPQATVTATINGVQVTTTAAALAAVAPETQIAVPHVAMLIQRTGNAGNGDHSHGGHVQGDNNGGSNAHANAMGARGQGGMRSGSSAANNF